MFIALWYDSSFSNEDPAFTWLRGGLRRLIVITTFHFADFRVLKHDLIRMKTMF